MKKLALISLFALTACSTTNMVEIQDNKQALAQHTAPIKIYGIGRYKPNSVILTLVDSQRQYFTIETPADTALKVGAVYTK